MRPSNNVKEKLLFFKIRNWADTDSFGQLYDMYAIKIYRYAYFRVGSVEEAQDITSQTFLKVWEYLISPESEKVRNINAFVYRVARNMIVDHFRKKGIDQEFSETIELAEEMAAPENTLDLIQKSLDKDALMAAIKKLKTIHQEVVLMRYVEDMDLNDIAIIINKSNGATRVLIHRALQELKNIINESK